MWKLKLDESLFASSLSLTNANDTAVSERNVVVANFAKVILSFRWQVFVPTGIQSWQIDRASKTPQFLLITHIQLKLKNSVSTALAPTAVTF